MANLVAGLLHQADTYFNPENEEILRKVRASLDDASDVTAIGLITGVAFSALGILSAISVPFNPVAIIPAAFFCSLGFSVSYMSFNIHSLIGNIRQILNNPRQYMTYWGIGSQGDGPKIQKKLLENTVAFNWFINNIMNELEVRGFCTRR